MSTRGRWCRPSPLSPLKMVLVHQLKLNEIFCNNIEMDLVSLLSPNEKSFSTFSTCTLILVLSVVQIAIPRSLLCQEAEKSSRGIM